MLPVFEDSLKATNALPDLEVANCDDTDIDNDSGDDLSTSRREENEVSTLKVVIGIGLVIAAGFSFTASNIIQKFYVPTLTFWQLLLHRAVVQVQIPLTLCIKCLSSYRFTGLEASFLQDSDPQ